MASTTTNMSLTAWDNANDFFNFSELAANWATIDAHNHTAGNGVQVPAGGLATNAVTSTNIAANAVTTAKVLDGNITAAKLAAGALTGAAVGTLPAARATRSANLSVADATEASVTMPTEDFDTNTMHDTGSNTERLTFTTAGIYLIVGWARFANNATGDRYALLRTNGASTLTHSTVKPLTTGTTNLVVTGLYNASASDYVDLRAWQNSGGALNVTQASISAHLVGKP